MAIPRRTFLGLAGLTAAQCVFGELAERLPAARSPRVVIVGGGWGGLAAARALRTLDPALDVVLVERTARWRSLPLSNKWLFGLLDEAVLEQDLAGAAARLGYTFLQGSVRAIERDRRRLVFDEGRLGYDWLVLATGIQEDWTAWFGEDRAAAGLARERFHAAYTADAAAQRALASRLARFAGGDLVMALPPMPYRCPPAPYERAAMIGWMLQQKRIPGRLVMLDPNPMMPAFARIFRSRFAEKIVYVPQAAVRSIDPERRVIRTDFDEYAFTEALLMPPQKAGPLVAEAGLAGADGWGAQDPVTLAARGDERVFLVGDLVGRASLLFGHYPKSGHLAAALGRIAAAQIAARASGREAPRQLPESTCYVLSSVEPPELFRIETRYRFRGDGEIQQTLNQVFDPQPRGEDESWARGQFAQLFGH